MSSPSSPVLALIPYRGDELALVANNPRVYSQAALAGMAVGPFIAAVQKYLPDQIAQSTYLVLFAGMAVGPEAFARTVELVLAPRASGLTDSDDEDQPVTKGGSKGLDGKITPITIANLAYNRLNVLSEKVTRILGVFERFGAKGDLVDLLALAISFADRFGEEAPDFAEALWNSRMDLKTAIFQNEEKTEGEVVEWAVGEIMADKGATEVWSDPRDYFRSREIGDWPSSDEDGLAIGSWYKIRKVDK